MRVSSRWICGLLLLAACGAEPKDSGPLSTGSGTGPTTGGDTAEGGTTEDTDEPDIPDGTLDEVLPIVQENCVGCHSPAGGLSGDLDLETDFCGTVLDGRLVIPGSTGESLLYRRVTSDDAPMPPSGRLDDDIIRPMGVWILNGAPCD